MGRRIASQVAARGIGDLAGLVFLGYPLHPPGRPDRLRAAHLSDVKAPMLFVQGSRDAFGTPEELRPSLHRSRPRPRSTWSTAATTRSRFERVPVSAKTTYTAPSRTIQPRGYAKGLQ